MEWPALAELAPDAFPKDVIARTKALQEEIGSIGAYSHSQGVPLIRQNVAKFIAGTLISLFMFGTSPSMLLQNATATLATLHTFFSLAALPPASPS